MCQLAPVTSPESCLLAGQESDFEVFQRRCGGYVELKIQ